MNCEAITPTNVQNVRADFSSEVTPHLDKLRSFIRSLAVTPADCDDILQQTMLRAFTAYHQFRGDSSFKTWIFRIAHNEFRQLARRNRRARIVPLQDDGAYGHSWEGAKGIIQSIADEQRRAQMLSAIRTLPAQYREAIELHDLRGLPSKEIAAQLSLTRSGFKIRHFRARRFLMQRMAEQGAA